MQHSSETGGDPMTSKTKQAKKQGRWVASRPVLNDPSWIATLYHTGHGRWAVGMITVEGATRAECRRRAAAIRDLANKEGW
jgi:hypothetical protein